jgi:hypothetical protein
MSLTRPLVAVALVVGYSLELFRSWKVCPVAHDRGGEWEAEAVRFLLAGRKKTWITSDAVSPIDR